MIFLASYVLVDAVELHHVFNSNVMYLFVQSGQKLEWQKQSFPFCPSTLRHQFGEPPFDCSRK